MDVRADMEVQEDKDFGWFINAFGTGYRELEKTRNPQTGRVNRLKKPLFCKKLLCAITRNESYVEYRSESEFHSFYRNTARRSLHPIAEIMINQNDIDKEKFKRFLNVYYSVCSKNTLYLSFKAKYTEFTFENLEEDIACEFVEIIQAAADEPDLRRKPPQPVSMSAESTKGPRNEDSVSAYIDDIDRTVSELITIGRSIAEEQKALLTGTRYTTNLSASLHLAFRKLTESASVLHAVDAPHLTKHISDFFTAVMRIEEGAFILTEPEYMFITSRNQHLHELLDKLETLKQAAGISES